MASMPWVRVISIDRARMTTFCQVSGSPLADDELVTTSERARPGNLSAKRVTIPAPSESPPR